MMQTAHEMGRFLEFFQDEIRPVQERDSFIGPVNRVTNINNFENVCVYESNCYLVQCEFGPFYSEMNTGMSLRDGRNQRPKEPEFGDLTFHSVFSVSNVEDYPIPNIVSNQFEEEVLFKGEMFGK